MRRGRAEHGCVERPIMKHAVSLGLLLATVILFAGCETRIQPRIEYDRPLPPGQLALRKITDPTRMPDFAPVASS